MLFLSSPSDDMPEPCSRAPALNSNRLRRLGDDLRNRMHDIARVVEGHRAGDPVFTSAACDRMYLALARNALDEIAQSLKDVEAEVMPAQPLPVSKPFGRRPSRDSALPATVSPARA